MKKKFLDVVRKYNPSLFLYLKYSVLKRKKSDINEHLSTLSSYAKECESVFETGVRGVVSSWALLHGLYNNKNKLKKIYLNDIVDVNVKSISNVASRLNIDFCFIKGNNLQLDLDERFDLTFIDTLHVYGQLKRELAKFSAITDKYIILHDTTLDGEIGEVRRYDLDVDEISNNLNIPKDELLVGLWPAVEEFLLDEPSWKLLKRFTNNNGLTILGKKET